MKMILFLNGLIASKLGSAFYHLGEGRHCQISQNIPLIQKRIIIILFLVGVLCFAFYLGNLDKIINPAILVNQSENPILFNKDISSVSTIKANNGDNFHQENFSAIDGNVWTRATNTAAFPARVRHTSVVFNDRIWVIGGEGESGELLHDVWYSTDGSHWSAANISAEFPGRYDLKSVVFDGRMWILGGWGVAGKSPSEKGTVLNDTWYSTDGITWTRATESAAFPARSDATSLVYDGKIWIISGCRDIFTPFNDVWYSDDGIHWFEANASAAFPARSDATSMVYNGRMWILGGVNSNIFPFNDVWYSTDGIIWTEANASAAFPARYGATSAVNDDKMWIIGGSNGKSGAGSINGKDSLQFFNDVWYSTDGTIWMSANSETDENRLNKSIFEPRMGHTSVVFKDKMWVIAGGLNRISDSKAGPFYIRFMNDTWYFRTRISGETTWTMSESR
jgi:N-acetylneuraminic acid mutarotase